MRETIARDPQRTAEDCLKEHFENIIIPGSIIDAMFTDSSFEDAIGVACLPIKAPVMLELLKSNEVAKYLFNLINTGGSIVVINGAPDIKIFLKQKQVTEISIPENLRKQIEQVLLNVKSWTGELNDKGEHTMDLRTPSPGPHFYINLLLGNRIGFPHALQTTPKSVVDRLGRGSFRSHAATQVLATRWDLRQEENGFPANRQFYLVENYKKIFYSGDVNDDNIESAQCTHSQNSTVISYKTKCGLGIKRTIFILPQIDGLPISTEVQQIEVINNGSNARSLKLIYTGMFGSAAPGAMMEDVLYSNIVMQTKLLKDENGSILAISPDYYRALFRADSRFHTMIVHNDKSVEFPKEFCANYNEFVGNGSLENPHGINILSNKLYRKGPGFFALASGFQLQPRKVCLIDNFSGLVSNKTNNNFGEETFKNEIFNLISRFSKQGETSKILEQNKSFYKRYSAFLQIESSDKELNTYFNENLPFQVLYQTFVSRSFCQTQKGYREIGFREIQDIYASMYYFVGMGMGDFVKQLLLEWCSKIFEFGFAFHNFFWEGKEPGKWSDDALWFIQAVSRYVNLTGDLGFMKEQCAIAGTDPVYSRTVYDTIKAVIRYSGKISIGKHELPLLDNSDWNDCLKLDTDFITGIEKEKRYRQQIEKGGKFGDAFESNYSESVMNAHLLKKGIDDTINIADDLGDKEYVTDLKNMSEKLYDRLQEHAWKDNYFARILFNRFKKNEFSFLGAKGDKLSADHKLDGTYFLNSFSWAILSDSATESQIGKMLKVIESVLKTPFGLKLMSPAALDRVSNNTAAGEYFPGDRENGGVFKHACMMATASMFKASKQVSDKELARKLARFAYWMVDIVLPFNTMKDPFMICGNPRFCTQYNNSETGENIGPMLSGTSTWLTLTLITAFGLEFTHKGIILDPILKEEQTYLELQINLNGSTYRLKIKKPEGFYRVLDGKTEIMFDGVKINKNIIPVLSDKKEHDVKILFQ
jgi:cellobiose phosphorylase